MKNLVIYQSSTGFTKKYAEWIGAALSAEAVDVNKLSKHNLSDYDCIIYGGWVMGNLVMGLDGIRKKNPPNLTVFAVGVSPASENVRDAIIEQNQLTGTPFYYFPGGMYFDRLNFIYKIIIRQVKKSIGKKGNKSEQDFYMENMLGTNFNIADRKYIEELINDIKNKLEQERQRV